MSGKLIVGAGCLTFAVIWLAGVGLLIGWLETSDYWKHAAGIGAIVLWTILLAAAWWFVLRWIDPDI